MKSALFLLLTLTSLTGQSQQMQQQLTASQLDWRIINDGVMGGLSQSRMETGEQGLARFSGEVSLANNGGFASTRAGLPEGAREGVAQISIRVKGDGKRYSLRLRPEGQYNRVSYRVYFDTAPGEWQVHTFSLAEFTPTFRGRVLAEVPAIKGQTLEEIGLLVADEQEGAFELLVDWIQVR